MVRLVAVGASAAGRIGSGGLQRHAGNRPMWEPLSESEARARMALEACGAGVWSWDAASDEIAADARYRSLYGFGADEVITSAAWQQRLHPADRDQLVQR